MQDVKGESVKIERVSGFVTVKDVPRGECFLFQENIFLKCEYSGADYLVVNLETGVASRMGSATVVVPKNLKVVPA